MLSINVKYDILTFLMKHFCLPNIYSPHYFARTSSIILGLIISINMFGVSYSIEVDNLQLVLIWIPTFWATNKCLHNLKQDCTLHSLWPNDGNDFTLIKAHKNCVSSSISEIFYFKKLMRINQSGYMIDMNIFGCLEHFTS